MERQYQPLLLRGDKDGCYITFWRLAHDKPFRIAVIGGGGHVGLPLSLQLVRAGFDVVIIDIDKRKLELLKRGVFPFVEEGGAEGLAECLKLSLSFSEDYSPASHCDAIILTVGTPVDEHLNPDLAPVYAAINDLKPYLHNGQTLVLRSTLFPGTSEKLYHSLCAAGIEVSVSFCPERIAQGMALRELRDLPQIISGSDSRAVQVARRIFSAIATSSWK